MSRFQLRTVRGYGFGEVSSAMQKAIRRADVQLAGYWALELWSSGFGNYVWKRLLTISAEDCWGIITHEVKALHDSYLVVNKGVPASAAKGRERRTELTTFTTITAAKVARANTKPFVSKKAGFIGWDLKRDEDAEPLGECSDLDEVMAISRDGSLKINRVAAKEFFAADILHAAIFQRGDMATTYNLLYEDKKSGTVYAKRFHMGEGITRDRIYPVAAGKILYLMVTASPDEAPAATIFLRDSQGARKKEINFDFSTLAVKNRLAQGNIVTKYKVQRVSRQSSC